MLFYKKKILVGITGGIAAYKVCFLVRSIKKQGGEVKTILTKAGERFVTKTTLETLSEEPVATDTFEPSSNEATLHIDLARWSDCFVIAPATANIIAKSANGIADDLLSTVILAHSGSIVFVPAMHTEMWENPATQRNIKLLRKMGHEVMPPGIGALARDKEGVGRMAEPEEIESYIVNRLGLKEDLKGKRILISAGRTEEAIDPVRYISNRSSGKMGVALAEEALTRGAEVTIIAGIHNTQLPGEAAIIHTDTAQKMAAAVKKEVDKHDVLIMAAAVADYRPVNPVKSKIKKSKRGNLSIELEPTEDILGSLGKKKTNVVMVGFSVETDNVINNSRKKLSDKNLDLIILNNPLEPGAGFDVDTNIVTLIEKNKKPVKLPLLPKREVARHILDRVIHLI